jgi:hypothetical protein
MTALSQDDRPARRRVFRILDPAWIELVRELPGEMVYPLGPTQLCESEGVLFVHVGSEYVREPRYTWNGSSVNERTELAAVTNAHDLAERARELEQADLLLAGAAAQLPPPQPLPWWNFWSADSSPHAHVSFLREHLAHQSARVRAFQPEVGKPPFLWKDLPTLLGLCAGSAFRAYLLGLLALLGPSLVFGLTPEAHGDFWSLSRLGWFAGSFIAFELALFALRWLLSLQAVTLVLAAIVSLALLVGDVNHGRSWFLLVTALGVGWIFRQVRGPSEEELFAYAWRERVRDKDRSVAACYRLGLLAQQLPQLRSLGRLVLELALHDIEFARLSRLKAGEHMLKRAWKACEAWRANGSPEYAAPNLLMQIARDDFVENPGEEYELLARHEKAFCSGMSKACFKERKACFANFVRLLDGHMPVQGDPWRWEVNAEFARTAEPVGFTELAAWAVSGAILVGLWRVGTAGWFDSAMSVVGGGALGVLAGGWTIASAGFARYVLRALKRPWPGRWLGIALTCVALYGPVSCGADALEKNVHVRSR